MRYQVMRASALSRRRRAAFDQKSVSLSPPSGITEASAACFTPGNAAVRASSAS